MITGTTIDRLIQMSSEAMRLRDLIRQTCLQYRHDIDRINWKLSGEDTLTADETELLSNLPYLVGKLREDEELKRLYDKRELAITRYEVIREEMENRKKVYCNPEDRAKAEAYEGFIINSFIAEEGRIIDLTIERESVILLINGYIDAR